MLLLVKHQGWGFTLGTPNRREPAGGSERNIRGQTPLWGSVSTQSGGDGGSGGGWGGGGGSGVVVVE